MSILQDYEDQGNFLGRKTMDAISEYLHFLESKGTTIFYSDIIYKKQEWQKFENWRKTVYNKNHGKSSGGDRKV